MATTKFDVLNRYTGEVQFTADIECAADAPPSVKLGLAVRWAVKARADLSGADLSGAYLSRAYLSGADLSGAYLSGAKIRDGLTLTRAPLFIGPIGRESGTLIAYATNDGLRLQRGCFFGTPAEFMDASDKTHGVETPVWLTYRAALTLIEAWATEQSA